MSFFATEVLGPTGSSEPGLPGHISVVPSKHFAWPWAVLTGLFSVLKVVFTPARAGSGVSFHQSSAGLFLRARYLKLVSAMTQGALDPCSIGASSRNHSQLIQTSFPCELMPFQQLFIATAQHYLSNIWSDSPFSPQSANTLGDFYFTNSLPHECDFRRDRIHPRGQMSWSTVRILEAEAKQGPFQKHRSLLLFIPPSSQLFLQQH